MMLISANFVRLTYRTDRLARIGIESKYFESKISHMFRFINITEKKKKAKINIKVS